MGEDEMRQSIESRGANHIDKIQQTAGSGGGSAPIATADGETARQAMGLQIGRQTAELALMQAQTKKTEQKRKRLQEQTHKTQ